MSDEVLKSIGSFIREKVIPPGMSVKDAAGKLGVGRPALSNLLNGKASLSPEMALRLERAFGAERQQLLDLQARLDQAERREEDKGIAVSAHVPRFLTITARQIEQWADGNLEARRDLPVLLRRLIHATGRELREVDFPGYDNAERKGWDGWVEAAGATPWIPEGQSGWEFGTNQDPRAKANSDYAARLKSVPAAERADITFVFVTPRNWNGKQQWAREKDAAGEWKSVRALDASDLEQWLETSIPAQIWLAEKLNLPTEGFETLDEAWHRWSAGSEPPMTPEIFGPSITAHRGTVKEWLDKPSDRPFIVAADSTDEALAFLACLFRDDDIAARAGDLAAVFDSARTLKTLASSTSPFIPIVSTEEAERALAGVYRRIHCIVVRPRNAVNSEPDIALDLLTHEDFEKALAAMGIDRDAADQLSRETGRSPTILRRRLSRIDAIRTPLWAQDDRVAKALIPMALVGAWHTRSKADCEVMSVLADRPYPEIEQTIAHLRQFDDSPVWSVGQYRGVASKMDALFAVSAYLTEKQLSDFLLLAEYVLSEQDPALELPEDQQWAAAIYGKVRNHSGVLREGICETLVILSVHGNNLFRDRLGFDAEAHVSRLIRQLLTPFTLDKLLSQEHDLPRYAEAAPDAFLTLLENDLQQREPVLLGLLKPVSTGAFGRCPRTGLLWALECLAWKPQNLGRVTAVLAQLSRIRIDDNWANKPIASLEAIFRSWMPQTAASLEDRIKVLEMLAGRFPDIAWQICIEQFSPGHRVGNYSYRPHWRSDASSAGQPVQTTREVYEFARRALTLAIAWPHHDESTLGDLVERLDGIGAEDQAAVWNLIDSWSDANAEDRARAALRERIRRFAFTRRGRRRDLNETTRDRAREAYDKLAPADLTLRHGWLFANQWVEESADELEDEAFDLTKREERIQKLRFAAMKEIWAARGFAGVSALLEDSKAPFLVGYFAAQCAAGETHVIEILRACLATDADCAAEFDAFMAGCIQSIAPDRRAAVLEAIAKQAGTDQVVRLLRCAPFGEQTWRLLHQQGQEIRDRYWREVYPHWNRPSEAEVTELIDRLLEAQRPRAAFNAVHMDWQKVETSRLKRLLFAVAGSNAELAGSFQLNSYEIAAALDELGKRAGVTRDEMARLEFVFIRALDHTEHGIPYLERQVTEAPAMFVQAVALAYKRSDNAQDPPEWQVVDEEHRAAVAMAAHHLLDQLHRVPGANSYGKVDTESLRQWITEARRLCAEHGRADIGDQLIGQLLSKAPSDADGLWPCRAVCEVMESVAAEHIGRGFHVGVINARGVHMRRPGGDQERELAAKYRSRAQHLAHDYPYVSSVVESIASSYDRDAEREDAEAMVNKRLRGWA